MSDGCGNCRFARYSEGARDLQCRRHAPHSRLLLNVEAAPEASDGFFLPTYWPAVLEDEWCGEWEARRG